MPYILLYDPKLAKNGIDQTAKCYISDTRKACVDKIEEVGDYFNVELRPASKLPSNSAWIKFPDNKVFARIGWINLGKVRIK